MKELLATIGVIGAFALLIFGLNYAGLINYQFFAPKYENARREVFENTKSYRDGTRRDFDNLYLAYKTAKSDDEKTSVLSVIRERAYDTAPELVPAEINQLIHQGN